MDQLTIDHTSEPKATSMAFLEQPSPITDEFLSLHYDITKRSFYDIVLYLYSQFGVDHSIPSNCETRRYTTDVYIGILFILPIGLLWEDKTDTDEMAEYDMHRYLKNAKPGAPTHQTSTEDKCQFLKQTIHRMPLPDLDYVRRLYELIDDHLTEAQVELVSADYECYQFDLATANVLRRQTEPPSIWYARLTHMREHLEALLGVIGDEYMSHFTTELREPFPLTFK